MLTACSVAELVAGCCGGPVRTARTNQYGGERVRNVAREGWLSPYRAPHFPGQAVSSLVLPKAAVPSERHRLGVCVTDPLPGPSVFPFLSKRRSSARTLPRMRPARARSTRMRRTTRNAPTRPVYRSLTFLLSSFLFFSLSSRPFENSRKTYDCYLS